MGLLDEIRKAIGPKCAQSVHFDSESLSVQGVSIKAGAVDAGVGGVNVNRAKIRDVSEAASALDQLQFSWCQSEGDPNLPQEKRQELAEKRVAVVGMITGLRFALIALQQDPSSAEFQARVDSWLKATQSFLSPTGELPAMGMAGGGTTTVRTELYTGGSFAGGREGATIVDIDTEASRGRIIEVPEAPHEPTREDALQLWSHLGLRSEDLTNVTREVTRPGR